MRRARTFNPSVASSSLAGSITDISRENPDWCGVSHLSQGHRSGHRQAPDSKFCGHCRDTKRVDEFNRDRTKSDGRQALCRECQKGNYRRGDNRGRHLERTKAYKAANPVVRKAHHLVEQALLRGDIQPQACACGAPGKDAHHHHRGYDHPLDVVWMCRSCHVTLEPRRGVA